MSGNEVLIKSVIQVIPTYVMSYIRLPRDIWHDICTNFWLGFDDR